MKTALRPVIFLLLAWLHIAPLCAQTYTNDFENQYTWYLPWLNLDIAADSTAHSGNFVCVCDTAREYGLGVVIEAGKELPNQNLH